MRSNKQAAPDSANHVSSRSSGLRETKKASGSAIHRLRHWKQSISLPASPLPKRARSRTMRSAGPSSLASKCVIRHVARTARMNLDQKAISLIASGLTLRLQVITDFDRPFVIAVNAVHAWTSGPIIYPQFENVDAALTPRNRKGIRHDVGE